jgi:hypothetical protein
MVLPTENFPKSYTGVTILEVCTWQSTAKLIGGRSWLQDLAGPDIGQTNGQWSSGSNNNTRGAWKDPETGGSALATFILQLAWPARAGCRLENLQLRALIRFGPAGSYHRTTTRRSNNANPAQHRVGVGAHAVNRRDGEPAREETLWRFQLRIFQKVTPV